MPRIGPNVGAAALGLLAASVAWAAEPAPTPVPSLALPDGRVLHHVIVTEDLGSSVIVRSDEGLTKVAKSILPAGSLPAQGPAAPAAPAPVSGSGLVMPPFDPDRAPHVDGDARPQQAPAKKPAQVQQAPAQPAPPAAYKGCTITSFELKAFQNVLGCAEVVIRNDGDSPVVIRPGDILCVTAGGERRPGRNFVDAEMLPPVIRRRDIVPPGGTSEVLVTFTNEALDISAVGWVR